MKPMSKAPGSKLLKLKYDKLLSNVAFNFNLRRYSQEFLKWALQPPGRGLHSSTFQLNLSRVGHTSPCPPV
jgi:hypothetical protein